MGSHCCPNKIPDYNTPDTFWPEIGFDPHWLAPLFIFTHE